MESILTWLYFTDIIFFSCFSLFKATSNQRYCCVDWLLKIYLDHEAKSVNLYYCCSCLPYKQQKFCGTFIKMPTDQHFTNFFGPLGSALDLESHLREDVKYLTWWCSFYVQYELSQIRLKEKNCCFHFCWIFNFYEYLWEQMNDINAGIWLSDDQRVCGCLKESMKRTVLWVTGHNSLPLYILVIILHIFTFIHLIILLPVISIIVWNNIQD